MLQERRLKRARKELEKQLAGVFLAKGPAGSPRDQDAILNEIAERNLEDQNGELNWIAERNLEDQNGELNWIAERNL